MVETNQTVSPRSPNADIFLKASDDVIEEVNKDIDEDPKYQYNLVVDEPEAYFNEQENDSFFVSTREKQKFFEIMK